MTTDITIVLDRSGSMQSIKSDMEGGIKTFLEDQKKTPDNDRISLYQFDDIYEEVFSNIPIDQVPEIQLKPRGATALFDAIGKTITTKGEYFASLSEQDRPDKILMIVITDGRNNASQEFTKAAVLEMIKHQEEKYNWTFVFLGASKEGINDGLGAGFTVGNSLQYDATSKGVARAFTTLSSNTMHYKVGNITGKNDYFTKGESKDS